MGIKEGYIHAFLRMVEILDPYRKRVYRDIIQFTADFKLASMIGRYYVWIETSAGESFKAYDPIGQWSQAIQKKMLLLSLQTVIIKALPMSFLSRGCHPISVMETFHNTKRRCRLVPELRTGPSPN